jgi:lysophospholipase L1-like esterase
MADGVVESFDADVLVILAGTNDAGWTPPEQIAADLVRIVDNAGVPEVVLSSVPPNDFASASSHQLNASLEDIAREQGWTWVDAAAGLREGDGYAEGMSYDGVHPTEEGARVLGEAIGPAVIEAGSD